MKVVAGTGNDAYALVYILDYGRERMVECVESLQPPLTREEKWVLLVSTLFGCPVQCRMCDAGGFYKGKLSKDELLQQIDFLVQKRYPDGLIPSRQFKIQFARMGEPALNPAVLDVLKELPLRYQAPGLMPSLSTIAPAGCDSFFEELLQIKQRQYTGGHFQFQFSLHTTDEALRAQLIPVKTWGFREMADYGERFFQPGDRKITLNFALAQDSPLDAYILADYFDPHKFLVKITPLNPTYRAQKHGLESHIGSKPDAQVRKLQEDLEAAGYQIILSIGETEENLIGSNCGQYLGEHLRSREGLRDGYTYPLADCAG